jgi:hypothetical protein
MTHRHRSAPGTLETIQRIPLDLDIREVKKRLHMEQRPDTGGLEALVDSARTLVTVRAVFKTCYIDKRARDGVSVDGVRFRSEVLKKTLADVGRVFPFVITIGSELEERARKSSDLLEQFYLDTVANVALAEASRRLRDYLCSRYALTRMSSLSPGSLADWPIEQQLQLFSLLGDVQAAIDVRLTDSLLMLPSKSISGILFPTEVPFVSCQLCPRLRCDSRKAPFDKEAAKRYGVIAPEH